jgi:transposase InsO family protein
VNVEQRKPRSITSLCSLLGYSRQGLYKAQQQHQQQCFKEDLLVQQVQKIRVDQNRIGGRRLHHMLQPFMHQHQFNIGRDSFFEVLLNNGLLVRRRKRKKPVTTDSFHRYKKYKNLIKEFIPVNSSQLWVSDITYIHLKNGFAYLSLITDAYSRKIVGFYLSKTLEATGSIRALKMALQNNKVEPNKLIHHSDRGVQYCCNAYIAILNNKKIKISMTENGDPLENAIAERVNGILKDELLEDVYKDFEAAQQGVAKAISVYNHLRPHSSISYKTPVEVHHSNEPVQRKWKNYYVKKEPLKVEVAHEIYQ